MEAWIVKMAELVEMAKLTSLIKEGPTNTFIKDWKPVRDFLLKMEKMLILEFIN